LKEFVKRIDSIIQKQKLKPIARGQNRLVTSVENFLIFLMNDILGTG